MTTFTLYQASLELAAPVVAADRAHLARPTLFLRATDGVAEGWSECPAAVERGVDPTVDELAAALEQLVTNSVASTGTTLVRHAAHGLRDAALLDLGLRHESRSLAAALGVTDGDVGFAGVVGIDEPPLARARARALVDLGASRIRVKVSPRSGTAAVLAVLDEVDVPVVADANGSLEPHGDHLLVDELLELPLAWLEQPFAPDRLEHTAALARGARLPIGLDESVTTVESIRTAARLGAAGVICIKPFRFGIQGTLEARREARRLAVRCYIGGYFEAGLGRAVLGALSALDDLDGDVAAPCTYLTSDPCGLARPRDGRQPLHVTPGCGPAPDTAGMNLRLERVADEPQGRRS